MEVLHARCCGIDVHKASLVACLRVQDGRRRHTEVRSFGTTTSEILGLHAWLSEAGCTHVAMESTGVYWIPLFQILEARGFEVCLVNAQHVHHVPGRKSDVLDCQWLQYLHSVGLLKASFRPEQDVCAVRSLCCGIVKDWSRWPARMCNICTKRWTK